MFFVNSQLADKSREFSVPGHKSFVTLDSLSIIPGTFQIYGPDSLELDPAFYSLDKINAELNLLIPEHWHGKKIWGNYRVFPYHLGKPVFFKDTSLIHVPGLGEEEIYMVTPSETTDDLFFDLEGIRSSGNIMRGVSVGNRQDMVLNSSMDIQLEGMLSEDLALKAVISDQHIPFQPEGTTQHLQDFDKVYIKVFSEYSKLTAGDFEIGSPRGHFMSFNKKAQGAKFSHRIEGSDDKVIGEGSINVTSAGAISRGKHARNEFNGLEGNQGPYKLTGSDNEMYIMVIAGSERVYIDGELMTRGKDHDYIIDYNMAEITFTTNNAITQNCRILVEFEYANRNYARSMFFVGTEYENDNLNVNFNFFSEQDHQNQPLFLDLTEERRELLAGVGDSIHNAYDWNVDSIGFKYDQIMYKIVDTLGYDSVFVYSTNPDKAVYQVGFSYVGEGQGNYVRAKTDANGRVYEWIEPNNGVPQGSYEPIIQLSAPRQDQMMTIESIYKFSDNTSAGVEWAMSNTDINRFSELHSEDNIGQGINAFFKHNRSLPNVLDGNWELSTLIKNELVQNNFSPIERYRSSEFKRDWNIIGFESVENENIFDFNVGLQHPTNGEIQYGFASFISGNQFSGIKNKFNTRVNFNKTEINYSGSYLNTEGFLESDFYRHRAAIIQGISIFKVGVESNIENNRMFEIEDSLKRSSFYFDEWKVFFSNQDTAKHYYKAYYKLRNDYKPLDKQFDLATTSNDYGLRYSFNPDSDHRIDLNTIYRKIAVSHDSINQNEQDDEEIIMGRIDHNSRFFDGFITTNSYYELSTGMEREREYMFVEVPPGQGVYVWNDYNENGIPELDEFEIAEFPEEANYIRVFLPTDEFIRTYSTAFSNTFSVEPTQLWNNPEGFRKFISRFNNRLNFRIDRRTTDEEYPDNFNPFVMDIVDTTLISLNSLIRNTLFFNRNNPVYGAEWTIQDNRNKMLLSNGFEYRKDVYTGLRFRWNITSEYSANLRTAVGERTHESEFLKKRTFAVSYTEVEPRINYHYSNNLRVSLFYGYETKEEILGIGGEYSVRHNGGVEIRYNALRRGTINARMQLSNIDYPFEQNTPLAFEMLGGLREGNNGLWNITWQQNLTEYLQMNLSYNGRKSPDTPIIHTGNVQVRAMF